MHGLSYVPLQSLHPPSLPPSLSLLLSLPPSPQEASKLDCRVVELECQLQQSGSQVASLHSKLQQGMGRVGELESELSRLKTTVEKLLPQIYALQSRLTHITNSPQVYTSSPNHSTHITNSPQVYTPHIANSPHAYITHHRHTSPTSPQAHITKFTHHPSCHRCIV